MLSTYPFVLHSNLIGAYPLQSIKQVLVSMKLNNENVNHVILDDHLKVSSTNLTTNFTSKR